MSGVTLRFPFMRSFKTGAGIPIVAAKSFCFKPRVSNSSRKISPGWTVVKETVFFITQDVEFKSRLFRERKYKNRTKI